MNFEIKNRWGGSVLFSLETSNIRLCVEAALRDSANLSSADLSSADLYGANLRSANLRSADLSSANLYGANLSSANLYGADLYGANLSSANLSSADLYGANLRSANLYGANLRSADGLRLTLSDVHPILQIGPIGSRSDTLIIFNTDQGVYVRTGCFFDKIEVFEERVASTHGTSKYGSDYQAAITLIYKVLKT